ncbi:P-loop containing nucleoside triphosphate hydrolase protein [Lipomyces oligophaga]|uniref:P-loop containing nucleoside triphosphate hydrolase protein n=1 Tax=Lipomyces oligophaga TaxID=45792 RepID=UPI0034CDCF9B
MGVKRQTKAEKLEKADKSNLVSFESLGLDARLVQAITRLKFNSPTLIQEQAIPLALQGKDIFARAKTGSGKTAAYVLPVVESILRQREDKPEEVGTRALILVPTKELADQCLKLISKILSFTGRLIHAENISQNMNEQVQSALLSSSPEIIVGTPSRVLAYISSSDITVSTITQIVIDEADLIMSFGYEDDLAKIRKLIPRTCQVFLMSATLSSEVDDLKTAFCHSPAILTLREQDEADHDGGKIDQYVVQCSEFDKFLLAYVIFKLNLIKGKTLVFVNDIDRCYRLKLFLEQFGIRSCVLNSDLPINSRLHVVEQFNRNLYSILIATDDSNSSVGEEPGIAPPVVKKSKKAKIRDSEYGVSRGIDFQNVACVLNFDLPTTARAYTHRIGRTGRAGNSGMALSFAVPIELWGKHKASSLDTAKRDEKILDRIKKDQHKNNGEAVLKPYEFDMKQIDAFRYRMEDAFRAVTKTSVRDARTRELRQEILTSDKLKKLFEESPEELEQLRHDDESHVVRVQQHLRHVPDYLLPEAGKQSIARDLGKITARKTQQNRIRRARAMHKARTKPKRVDPLKSFKGKKVTK